MLSFLRGRGAAVLAAALVLASLLAVAAQQDAPEVPEGLIHRPMEDTQCYTCHREWTPPLRRMIAILPPLTTGAPVGEIFDYSVQFQQAWNPASQVPHLLRVNPILDISQAPSLRFVLDIEDIHKTETHSIILRAGDPRTPQSNLTVQHIPPGVTSLGWSVAPVTSGDSGPRLTLIVRAPSGNETRVRAPGPGQSASVNFTNEELQVLGGGNWTVGAEVTPFSLTEPGIPQLTRVDYRLTVDALYDTGALKTYPNPRDSYIAGGGRVIQNWKLRFVEEPVAGEKVDIRFETAVWYKHNPPVGNDLEGFREAKQLAVGLAGGIPSILNEEVPIAERPRPVNGPTLTTVSEAVGYASAFLFVSSIVSGGMFGQASRRGLNSIFQSAKRRVAYHNFLSYGLTVAAVVHTGIFLFRFTEQYQWTLGIIWGGIALLAMFGLGVTGALQVPMIRKWSYPTWKWWHYGLTIVAIVFTIVHMLLDGAHFPEVQEALGWRDPFYNPVADLKITE